ncbi:DoxX family membrane protein [Palleronia sp. KMU-117]|uniref:DoxX family membrane protein n=1 Tax=Palleronia sp. KMU-117 TaxID=3434108 RepID=UPI003D760DF7
MNALVAAHQSVAARLDAVSTALIPTLARLTFAGVLLIYFWNAARTKLGDGVLGFLRPSDGAYIQIFPRAVEAAGYDVSQLGVGHWAIAVAGTWAEFLLPLLIVLGLLTRLAALGMIGFVAVQTWVDITGHGLGGADIGGWFDRAADAIVADQRALWVFLLLTLVLKGAGPLSADRLLARLTAGSRREDGQRSRSAAA